MRVSVRGRCRRQAWRLLEVDAFEDRRQAGECCKTTRTIRVLRGLSEAERLRVVVHELLHAMDWGASEGDVDRASVTIRDALRQMGYARPKLRVLGSRTKKRA